MDQNKKRYILANIKIPIEITDNTTKILPEYITIDFEDIKKLQDPPENNTPSHNSNIQTDYDNIKNQIKTLLTENNSMFSNNKEEPSKEKEIIEQTPIITHDELRTRGQRIHKKNLTFKNKKSAGIRYTSKNYSVLQKQEDTNYGKG
jgi:hypothetical protein